MSPWMILLIAGLLEIVWSIGLKYTDGFSKLYPSVITVAAMVVSLYLLGIAAKSLPIGTAYAVWVGIGSFGAGILGILLFKEPASIARIGFLILLMISIIGLKFTSAS